MRLDRLVWVLLEQEKTLFRLASCHTYEIMNLQKTIGLVSGLAIGTAFGATENFSKAKAGSTGSIASTLGEFQAEKGHMAINSKSVDDAPGSLHLSGGADKEIVLELSASLKKKPLLAMRFHGERWTGQKPFAFSIEGKVAGKWQKVYDGDKLPLRQLSTSREVDLGTKRYEAFRFKATTKEGSGVLLDNITLTPDGDMKILELVDSKVQVPVLVRKDDASVLNFSLETEGSKKSKSVKEVYVSASGTTSFKDVESFTLVANGSEGTKEIASLKPSEKLVFKLSHPLVSGSNKFSVRAKLKNPTKLSHRVQVKLVGVKLSDRKLIKPAELSAVTDQRIGFNVATGGDEVVRTDGSTMVCKRMRIPGMVTSKAGTLLAVYDLRWRQNGDLPGDIDVGLSRSTNGGLSWEAPRPVLDMGTWLDQPENKNGVGDPAILVDDKTGHIYITGLVAHGLSGGWYWGLSKPGLDPKDTGQVVITKSEDDGKTWSKPINLTPEIKDPEWQLMLQGPGAGISMRDGTLVFAFQYKANIGTEDAPKYSACSSIMYSKDHGKTWKVAPGVDYPQETTEAQVVELNDGSLMLNCRISAGGRAVFTTTDLGETWTQHKTSGRGTFNMSGCMASILRHSSTKDGDEKDILLFSGPADGGKKRRTHMSVRYSLDEGETWSEPYLLDQIGGAYSCLSLIEENGKKGIGVIYEGSQSNMCFERITLDELMSE